MHLTPNSGDQARFDDPLPEFFHFLPIRRLHGLIQLNDVVINPVQTWLYTTPDGNLMRFQCCHDARWHFAYNLPPHN